MKSSTYRMGSDPLYEDQTCLVVVKPTGMATMHDAESGFASMEQLWSPYLPAHRLDNDTSGCLLLAKDDPAYQNLRHQFMHHHITKRYLALVHGLTPTQKDISFPIAHHAKKSDRMIVVEHPDVPHRGDPQPARTMLRTLQHCYPTALFPHPLSWVMIDIATGVRHQIRVHLAHSGHALVGDRIYGRSEHADESLHHLLHAYEVTFRSPDTGQLITVQAPLPPLMRDFAREFQLPLPRL